MSSVVHPTYPSDQHLMDPFAVFGVQEYTSRKAITGEPSKEKEQSHQYSPRMPASPRDNPKASSDYKKVFCLSALMMFFPKHLHRENVVDLLLKKTQDCALIAAQLRHLSGEKVPLVLTRIPNSNFFVSRHLPHNLSSDTFFSFRCSDKFFL